LASASHDTTIRIWEVNNQYCLRVLKKHLDPIERISFSPDGTKLATGANGAVLIWNAETGTATHVYDRIKTRKKTEEGVMEDVGEINEISWDQTGTRLAVGEGSTKVCFLFFWGERVWDSKAKDVTVCNRLYKYEASPGGYYRGLIWG
jgi:transducin (beta)-like 1